MKIVYLVSGKFDYFAATNPDSGPQYAEDIGLTWEKYTGELESDGCIYILDQRMTPDEIEHLKKVGESKVGIRIVFRFVDPFYETEGNSVFTRLAFAWSTRTNSALLSGYQPKELAALLQESYGAERFHVSPYPYVAKFEKHRPWVERRRKVIISGNSAGGFYPARTFARHKRKTSLRWRLMSADLNHPGYMAGKSGGKTGDKYLEYLSEFKMMYVCPGRSALEFMKYRECGYAGCVPVGPAPTGFPSEAADCLLSFDWVDFRSHLQVLSSAGSEELQGRAERYRAAMRSARDPDKLRNDLMLWLASVFHS